MKTLCIALLLAGCALLCAQTNAPAPREQQVEVSADSGYFDGLTNQMVYIGHVYVTDNDKAKLYCERLTVDVPGNGEQPTNIIAETNVVIDLVDSGHTNHITANRAVYAFSLSTNTVGTIVTNQTVTFTGGDPQPKVETPDAIITAEPLILDVPTKNFGGQHYKTIFKEKVGTGTNAMPFGFSK